MENNEKENLVIDDFDFSLIADFFRRVDRQGPGGDWETRLATSLIPNFNRKIRIADIGCGTGSQTFVLADEYDADIDAVDLLPEMIEGIREKTRQEAWRIVFMLYMPQWMHCLSKKSRMISFGRKVASSL